MTKLAEISNFYSINLNFPPKMGVTTAEGMPVLDRVNFSTFAVYIQDAQSLNIQRADEPAQLKILKVLFSHYKLLNQTSLAAQSVTKFVEKNHTRFFLENNLVVIFWSHFFCCCFSKKFGGALSQNTKSGLFTTHY